MLISLQRKQLLAFTPSATDSKACQLYAGETLYKSYSISISCPLPETHNSYSLHKIPVRMAPHSVFSFDIYSMQADVLSLILFYPPFSVVKARHKSLIRPCSGNQRGCLIKILKGGDAFFLFTDGKAFWIQLSVRFVLV